MRDVIDPDDINIYRQLGNSIKAIPHFISAIKLRPNNIIITTPIISVTGRESSSPINFLIITPHILNHKLLYKMVSK